MKAIFLFKNGQEQEMDIPEALPVIYLPVKKNDSLTQEIIELTPENIINKGGFTQPGIGQLELKIGFEFKGSNKSYLFYEEMQ